MKKIDWAKEKEASNFELLPSGGYICQILRVKDEPNKEYLTIEFDVAAGEYKDYFLDACAGRDFWSGRFIKSYKPKARGFFKSMLTAVEESNPDFKADTFNDEKQLEGKRIGLTIGHEQYWNSNGEKRTRIYVDQTRSVKAIESSDFKVPKDRVDDYNKPADDPMDGFNKVIADDEVPF